MKDKLWAKGYFAQSMSKKEVEEKEKTIHKKHDEDMNFNCKECNTKISAHNKDWHDCMCDGCFNGQYFPEEAQIFETDIEKIKIHCKSKPIERENMKFWEFLKSDELDQERFGKIVDEITKQIDCTKCANCCKALGAVLNESDIERISKHFNLAKEDFISKYLTKNSENVLEIKQLPCPFLKDSKCQIYEIRPETCKNYPNLDKDVTIRCHQFFPNAEICPIVFNVLENAKEEFLEDIYAFENPDTEVRPMGEKEIQDKLKNFNQEQHSVSKLCKGIGTGITAINDNNREAFYPLLLAIEEAIYKHYSDDNSLRDSDIIESLKKIRDNIFSDSTEFNDLEEEIITRIKEILFLNKYNKGDVSLSISSVLKSAKLHRSIGGSRGYLEFISGFFNQM